ncbi:helix-turn-helix transcriptional regulator [Bacillus dakarensis]|uniref:helix-turn-helix transcriptional regulator n=1 Tax=Robertmurraya dakarensis TaxID=1926278 RepID=UPI00137A8F36|nr:LuxR C-terminal-related transcriptional regulator [Bacillus dakarensis]
MQDYLAQFIDKIEQTPNHEDRLIKILEVYLEAFPSVLDAYLFRYSPLGHLTEGILAIGPEKGLFHIRDIRDDVRTVPLTHNAIRQRQAAIISKEDFIKYNPRYSFSSHTAFLTVIPICFSSNVVGILHSTRFSESSSEIEKLLPIFQTFGRLAGHVFESSAYEIQADSKLANREIEVMQKLAWGESTKTIARNLNISEYTVKDYIKTSILKLGSANRTQAVADLIRRGIIS